MTRNTTETITIRNVEMNVKGSYFSGYPGDWENPPEEPSFCVEHIEVTKGNLVDLLEAGLTTDEIMFEIENLSIERCQYE